MLKSQAMVLISLYFIVPPNLPFGLDNGALQNFFVYLIDCIPFKTILYCYSGYTHSIFFKGEKLSQERVEGGGVNIRKNLKLVQIQVMFYPFRQGMQIFDMHVFSAGFQDTLFF